MRDLHVLSLFWVLFGFLQCITITTLEVVLGFPPLSPIHHAGDAIQWGSLQFSGWAPIWGIEAMLGDTTMGHCAASELILWRRHSTDPAGSTSSNSPPNSCQPLYYLLKSKMKYFQNLPSWHTEMVNKMEKSIASTVPVKLPMQAT